MADAPRFELAPTTRFADRAKDYALYRPSYPDAAIDAALHGLPGPASLVAADIGAGTGISARLFADRGVRVLAIEPNAAMRESAEPHQRITFMGGSAEATGLLDASVDLVICAQAFHWFRPREALAEFRRILKPSGRLVLLVNERDDSDPATRAYNAAIRTAAERELSECQRALIDEALGAAGVPVVPGSFAYAQTLSREGLIGRARSASYVPREGPRYEAMLDSLDRLWETHRDPAGLVALRYKTLVWVVPRMP